MEQIRKLEEEVKTLNEGMLHKYQIDIINVTDANLENQMASLIKNNSSAVRHSDRLAVQQKPESRTAKGSPSKITDYSNNS